MRNKNSKCTKDYKQTDLFSLENTQEQHKISEYCEAIIVEFWCAEPFFFASNEISASYYTEPVIGNYALAYAWDWILSPYRLYGKETNSPTYLRDINKLVSHCYIFPAYPKNFRFRFEFFNTLSDSYWFLVAPNKIMVEREDLLVYLNGSGKCNSSKPSNFPQAGRIRMIDRGSCFTTVILRRPDTNIFIEKGDKKEASLNLQLPQYFRIGKFKSKIKLTVLERLKLSKLSSGIFRTNLILNTADIPQNFNALSFDLISMPPVSLIKNVTFKGEAWQLGEMVIPANITFLGGGR